MDGFEDGHAVVISKDEVKFFVHNDVLFFMCVMLGPLHIISIKIINLA